MLRARRGSGGIGFRAIITICTVASSASSTFISVRVGSRGGGRGSGGGSSSGRSGSRGNRSLSICRKVEIKQLAQQENDL